VLHSAFGIYVVEKVFTNYYKSTPVGYFKNSDGVTVSIRDVAEKHVLEDIGRIPPLSDYLNCMKLEQWMGGPVVRSRRFISMED